MADIIQEILKWANGTGNRGVNSTTVINYSSNPNAMAMNGIKFNSEPQVSRTHPVVYGELNPSRNGIKFNS